MSDPARNPDSSDADRIVRLFEQLPSLVNRDGDLVRRGRFLVCEMELGIGALSLLVSVANGEIRSVARGPFLLRSAAFSIHMPPEDWAKFLAPIPEPGWHDLMALSKRGTARIAGNLQPFMANLQYIKDVLAAPRALEKDKAA